VNRRLSELVDHGFVKRVKRGYYEITETGEQYLAGDIDPDDI
jgi:predicted transcriptional regulator